MKKYWPLLCLVVLFLVPLQSKADDLLPPDQLECQCQAMCGTTASWCVVPCEIAYYVGMSAVPF